MIAMEFIDTNVLIYATSTREREATKRTAARTLPWTREFVVAVQVLQEFYVQATRPGRVAAMPHPTAADFVNELIAGPGVNVQPNIVKVL